MDQFHGPASFLASGSACSQGSHVALSVAVHWPVSCPDGVAAACGVQDIDAVETLASLLVDEVAKPSKHAVYAESLAGSIVTGLLDIPEPTTERATGRLTQGQMNKLLSRVDASGGHRLTVAEMAETVGLSEDWFANVFKQTLGKTPQQWQLARRIEAARQLLADTDLTIADIAAQLNFSDQAHLTKAFRQITGETPTPGGAPGMRRWIARAFR